MKEADLDDILNEEIGVYSPKSLGEEEKDPVIARADDRVMSQVVSDEEAAWMLGESPAPVVNESIENNYLVEFNIILEGSRPKLVSKYKDGSKREVYLNKDEVGKYRDALNTLGQEKKNKGKKVKKRSQDPSYLGKDANTVRQTQRNRASKDVKSYVKQNPKNGKDVDEMTNVGCLSTSMMPNRKKKKKENKLSKAMKLADKLRQEK